MIAPTPVYVDPITLRVGDILTVDGKPFPIHKIAIVSHGVFAYTLLGNRVSFDHGAAPVEVLR